MVLPQHQMTSLSQAESLGIQDFQTGPIRVQQIEFSQPLPELLPAGPEPGLLYAQGHLLIRLHGQPLGTVDLPLGETTWPAGVLGQRIWQVLGRDINEHLVTDGLPPVEGLPGGGIPPEQTPGCIQVREQMLAKAPFASVVVATRNRTDSLAVTLQSLLSMEYTHLEIIVVDNAPSSEDTAEFIRQAYGDSDRVRYVREDRPGLAAAHNRGLREVQGSIVAFTDDDVIVDWHWLAELVLGFEAGENVGCVTGMIFPAALDTPAQVLAEQMVRFNKGYRRQVYDLGKNRPDLPLFPFAAGVFGSGANMAFRASALRAIGGFDPLTGTGTPAMGGDDLSAFFDIVHHRFQLVYQPSAIVYHPHRRDYPGLLKQAYGYGAGLTAYLTRVLFAHPETIPGFLARVPAGVAYALHPGSLKNQSKQAGFPGELTRTERRGMVYGPLAYLRSRWAARKYARTQAGPALPVPRPGEPSRVKPEVDG